MIRDDYRWLRGIDSLATTGLRTQCPTCETEALDRLTKTAKSPLAASAASGRKALYNPETLCQAPADMLKRFLPFLFAPLLLAGCTSTFTNLSPVHQTRNTNNLYPVEVAMASRQQTLRWDSIKPQIVVGNEVYPMRPTALMTNRWEGLVPVPPGATSVHYRYKFDFDYNSFGHPKADSALSPEYTLHINEP